MSYMPREATDARYVDVAGDTMTSDLNISGAAATTRRLQFRTGANPRWDMVANSVAESGSNAGSDFGIQRYSDTPAYIDTPLSINRQNGAVVMPNGIVTLQGSGVEGRSGSVGVVSGTVVVPLTSRGAKWGDPAVVDLTGFGSGYFRVSKAGIWNFNIWSLFSWAGDGFYLSGSTMINCLATNYIQGYYYIPSITPSRFVIGVSISGGNNVAQEAVRTQVPATLTSVDMRVFATYMGPNT